MIQFKSYEGKVLVTSAVTISPRAAVALTSLLMREEFKDTMDKYQNLLNTEFTETRVTKG